MKRQESDAQNCRALASFDASLLRDMEAVPNVSVGRGRKRYFIRSGGRSGLQVVTSYEQNLAKAVSERGRRLPVESSGCTASREVRIRMAFSSTSHQSLTPQLLSQISLFGPIVFCRMRLGILFCQFPTSLTRIHTCL